MTEIKHTPAPWKGTFDGENDLEVLGPNGELVVFGCGCCGSPYGDNFRHDVPLIVAAPLLLASLKKFLSHTDGWDETQLRKRWGPQMVEQILEARAIIKGLAKETEA